MGLIDRIKDVVRGARGGDAVQGATTQTGPAATDRAHDTRDARQVPAEPAASHDAGPGAADRGEGPEEAAVSGMRYDTVTVQPGDTLSEIAQRRGVDLQQMVELNGIEDPDLIFAGQVFKLPRN
ncbi:LysM peptidoglycan-binding domain-containing protein [Serinicoccus profundi]|uniref:LysM peptidoglycan-binding domain-containing protein n=1 Tax=Serinicoccus profundi TaxID=1078471 RepID=UPI000255E887|nr:LysM domain-containing protein [Serinicoccus profundi]